MTRIRATVCLAGMAILHGWVASAAAPAAGPLTWEDCVRLAEAHNPALVAAREQIAASVAGIDIARAAQWPQFSLGSSATHSERDAAVTQDDVAYAASVNVEQSLYSGGRNQASRRVAEATRDGTLAQATASAATITYDLRSAFIDLLHAQAQTALLIEIEGRRKNNQELVELRYEGGREHKGSLALSEATLYDAETQTRQAQRRAKVAGETLVRTIGLTVEENRPVAVVGDLEDLAIAAASIGNLEDAASLTPAYARAQATRSRAAAQLDQARSGNRPAVNLAGSAGRTGNEAAFDDDQWSVGLRLSLPFWQGGRAAHDRTQAGANLLEAEAALADTYNTQARTLAELQAALQDAVDAVAVQTLYVKAATVRAEISRQQYEDGMLTFENWDLIENDLINKRKGLLASQRAAQIAEAVLERGLGSTVFAGLEAR